MQTNGTAHTSQTQHSTQNPLSQRSAKRTFGGSVPFNCSIAYGSARSAIFTGSLSAFSILKRVERIRKILPILTIVDARPATPGSSASNPGIANRCQRSPNHCFGLGYQADCNRICRWSDFNCFCEKRKRQDDKANDFKRFHYSPPLEKLPGRSLNFSATSSIAICVAPSGAANV
jgi:hypothetical protein